LLLQHQLLQRLANFLFNLSWISLGRGRTLQLRNGLLLFFGEHLQLTVSLFGLLKLFYYFFLGGLHSLDHELVRCFLFSFGLLERSHLLVLGLEFRFFVFSRLRKACTNSLL